MFANSERAPSGNHEFDKLCEQFGIAPADPARTPKTNGMVERFREDLQQTLLRYVALYNHQLPQSALEEQDADAGHERVAPLAPAFV